MNDAERIAKAGGIVDIGPECFALRDGSLISWRGENYVPQKLTLRARFYNWRAKRWNKRHS